MTDSSSQWQLKGNAPKIYDLFIAPAVSAPWYPLLVESGPRKLQGAIADIGCGTGSFLFHLASHENVSDDSKLVGIDVNAAMLTIAQDKNEAAQKRISFVRAEAKQLPFDDGYFNVAYCQQGIQYFKEKADSLKEIHRVIADQGVFVATTWSTIDDCVGYKCLSEAVLKIAGDRAKPSLQAPFSLPHREMLEVLAKDAGFRSVSVKTVDSFVCFPSIKDFAWHRIYGSPLIDDLPKTNTEKIVDEIILDESTLGLYQTHSGLAFPVKANLLIANK